MKVVKTKQSFLSSNQSTATHRRSHHDQTKMDCGIEHKKDQSDEPVRVCVAVKGTGDDHESIKWKEGQNKSTKSGLLVRSSPSNIISLTYGHGNRHFINSALTWQCGRELRALDQDQRGSEGVQLACGKLERRGRRPALAAEKTTV